MSEIADELERFAARFYEEAKVIAHESPAGSQAAGHGDGLRAAAAALLARAGEIRQQRSGPTYKPQPKPAEVKAGQWWMFRGNEPERITSIEEHEHGARAFFSDLDYEYTPVSRLLDNYLFEYLGDGREPAR